MKLLKIGLIALSLMMGISFGARADIETPFPLGAKAPLPWETMNGYWTDWKGQKYYYRIEILEVYKDKSRTVSVALLDEEGQKVVATGLGFVRADSRDLWANVSGDNISVKLRLQAYYAKEDTRRTALVASLRDMSITNPPLIKHMLIKVNTLDSVILPSVKGCKP